MGGVIGVIQARMGSTRLPGKLLAPIAGRPLLEVLVRRIRRAAVDELWLATSTNPEDDVAAAWGEALGLRVFRGDPDDVLSRFVAIAESRRPAWMLRFTADSPFVDAPVVDALLAAAPALPAGVDHLADDPARRRLPRGYVPELIRGDGVLIVDGAQPPWHHRVHVTSWLVEVGRSAPFQPQASWPDRPAWRWTVDTAIDLAMADAAFAAFGDAWETVDYPEMVRILDAQPEIAARNANERQKALTEG